MPQPLTLALLGFAALAVGAVVVRGIEEGEEGYTPNRRGGKWARARKRVSKWSRGKKRRAGRTLLEAIDGGRPEPPDGCSWPKWDPKRGKWRCRAKKQIGRTSDGRTISRVVVLESRGRRTRMRSNGKSGVFQLKVVSTNARTSRHLSRKLAEKGISCRESSDMQGFVVHVDGKQAAMVQALARNLAKKEGGTFRFVTQANGDPKGKTRRKLKPATKAKARKTRSTRKTAVKAKRPARKAAKKKKDTGLIRWRIKPGKPFSEDTFWDGIGPGVETDHKGRKVGGYYTGTATPAGFRELKKYSTWHSTRYTVEKV